MLKVGQWERLQKNIAQNQLSILFTVVNLKLGFKIYSNNLVNNLKNQGYGLFN